MASLIIIIFGPRSNISHLCFCQTTVMLTVEKTQLESNTLLSVHVSIIMIICPLLHAKAQLYVYSIISVGLLLL